MSGFDIIIEKNVAKKDLKNAMATAFGVLKKNIFISDDYVDTPLSDEIKIWCITTPIEGDFSLNCMVFIRDENITCTAMRIVKELCNLLSTNCLISNENVDPFEWILINPNGNHVLVNLNSDELENNRYILSVT
ncbi:hypothetical protein [Proteus sp. TJ1640]|uniref:hypothetical protein n=1 Tax=Proteus sp. TJ1640 TaxID=2050968 RepID=UPI000D69C99A|nr:hypothetical protein [Proteus sp. TJ1640]